MTSEARQAAASALVRVWRDEAFATVALDRELARVSEMDPRDVALATELTYGVLRTQGFLTARVEEHARRGRHNLSAEAKAHLLIGAYSLLFLDRVPDFAAVSQAVSGVKRAEGPRAAGFANAVLRAMKLGVDESRCPELTDAIAAGAPGWLRGALRRTLGRAGATAYLTAGPVPPPIGICVRDPSTRDGWLTRFSETLPNAQLSVGKRSAHAILIRGGGDVRKLAGYETDWIVQEEGAQLVALAADAQPGEQVLDACAGRGNKVWLLSREVEPGGAVDASDLFATKLEALKDGGRRELARRRYAVDWRAGTGDVPDDYDRALIDAPCSGIGTLRRRPEIALRRTEEDVARLAELQVTVTRSVATRVRDGGVLAYAVCSVLREEGEAVLEALTAPDAPGPKLSVLGEPERFLPHVDGTDGYFVARLRVSR